MGSWKPKYYLSLGIIFLVFFAISLGIYLFFFNKPTLQGIEFVNDVGVKLIYESDFNYDKSAVLIPFAAISMVMSFGVMLIYQEIKIKKAEVITEKVEIINKEQSYYVAAGSINCGGNTLRRNLVIKIKFNDGNERYLIVDKEHYIAAENGDRVLLSYKKFWDSFIFVDFVKSKD